MIVSNIMGRINKKLELKLKLVLFDKVKDINIKI